jgi:hypothetical protein
VLESGHSSPEREGYRPRRAGGAVICYRSRMAGGQIPPLMIIRPPNGPSSRAKCLALPHPSACCKRETKIPPVPRKCRPKVLI